MIRVREQRHSCAGWLSALLVLISVSPLESRAVEFNLNNPLNPPALIYWCPNRTPDQQYAGTPEPGCRLLLEEGEKQKAIERRDKLEEKPLRVQSIESEASRFAREYRVFLECCASRLHSLDEVVDLEERAVDLLLAIQETGLINAVYASCTTNCRGFTTGQIIRTVAEARDDLRRLKSRLQRLAEARERLQDLDYQTAGVERVRIQEEQESLAREFRSKAPPEAAPTGMEIEDTTLSSRIGTTIEDNTLPKGFGPDIGYVVSPDSDQQVDLRFRFGLGTEDTTLPTRYGTSLGGGNTPPADLPTWIGFEIGAETGPTGRSTTPVRVGPKIGDSSLNAQNPAN